MFGNARMGLHPQSASFLAAAILALFILGGRCAAQGQASGALGKSGGQTSSGGTITLAHPGFLVSARQLEKELATSQARSGILVVDVRSPKAYRSGHIPGAVNLPLAELQHSVTLSNGRVSPAIVKPAGEIVGPLRRAGINEGSHIVLYDGGETYDATRVWWMLDYYGVPHIAVLDGGLPAWRSTGGGVSTASAQPPRGDVTPVPNPDKIASFAYVEAHIGTKATALCDALSASSYRAGAIPGSISLPWTELYKTNAFGELKGANELAALLQSLRLTRNHPIIFYCRRGYVSSLEYFVARALGYTNVRLYDGSESDFIAHGAKLVPSGG